MYSFFNQNIHFTWDNEKEITHWLDTIAMGEKKNINSLSYIYCCDNYLLTLNKKHLNHHDWTDVLTFNFGDENQTTLEGEIYISIERVFDNSLQFKQKFEKELCRVMAHGLLHLCGYCDHDTHSKNIMTTKENFYLAKLKSVPRGTYSKNV